MELWVRSQNKERLRLVDSLRVYQEDEGQIDFNIQDGGCILGTYKTKERALEVLDEIQELLVGYINAEAEGNQTNGILGTTYIKTCFYEMPKE